jgi:hypothetical protein
VASVLLAEGTMVGGERLRVERAPRDVEAAILSAGRGSLLEFAWLSEAVSGQRVGMSPDQVLMLRGVDADSDGG